MATSKAFKVWGRIARRNGPPHRNGRRRPSEAFRVSTYRLRIPTAGIGLRHRLTLTEVKQYTSNVLGNISRSSAAN